jgi:hypothetical protein
VGSDWGQGSNLIQLRVRRFRALTPNFSKPNTKVVAARANGCQGSWTSESVGRASSRKKDAKVIAAVVSRLGVADVRAFGLAWEDCEELLG